MFQFVLAMIATATPNVENSQDVAQVAVPQVASPSVSIGENVQIGEGVTIGGAALLDGTNETQTAPVPSTAPAVDDGINRAVIPAGLVAEPQVPTGKFTTAAEIKPIMSATKGNWIAVREYDGSDLLYVTHIWSWRCGLAAMAISVNDEPMQNWPLPKCHDQFATPNAILEDDGLPFLKLKLGGVQKVTIQLVYDDLSVEAASFARSDVLIP